MGCASGDDSKGNGGDAMKTTVFCNQCGAAMTDADRFCASCGIPVVAMPQAVLPAVTSKTIANPWKLLTGFGIAYVVVVVIRLTMFTSDTRTIDWPATIGATAANITLLGAAIWLINKFIDWRQS